ncbi:uncharacterized protein C8orf88 homolog isoform X3 [Dendropsophus ebraccatus]|uniref:uncharacterized protein C8orf88 homolog isoform X3 n=1 Tax=Dendropsophus ebraccatus TaxID=150705 RepID=UPI0038310724
MKCYYFTRCCALLLEMDVKRLIHKRLEPARPIRRFLPATNDCGAGEKRGAGAVFINFQATFTDCTDDLKDLYKVWCSFQNLHDVFKEPVVEKPEKEEKEPPTNNNKDRVEKYRSHSEHAAAKNQVEKSKRITYTRDLLLQLSNLSVSKKKPKYLPDLPIILEHPVSSLHCDIDAWSPADMQNTHLLARADHYSYHL